MIFLLPHRETVFYFVHDFPFCLYYYLSRLSLPVVHVTHPAHYSFCKEWRGYLASNYDDRLVSLNDSHQTSGTNLLIPDAQVSRQVFFGCLIPAIDVIASFLSVYYSLTIPPLRSHTTQANYNDFFFRVALRPSAGHGPLLLDVSKSHTATNHIR